MNRDVTAEFPGKGSRITVLAGGCSPEREVSLRSGERVAAALRRRGFLVATVDPGAEYRGTADKRFSDSVSESLRGILEDNAAIYHAEESDGAPVSAAHSVEWSGFGHRSDYATDSVTEAHSAVWRPGVRKGRELTLGAIEICRASDAVFLALHGGGGENGMIAAALESLGIPHTGSSFGAMYIAMDKGLSKRLLESAGVRTPRGFDAVNPRELPRGLRYPCVLKPMRGGSSIGVEIIHSEEELRCSLDALGGACDCMIEEYIGGREFTVGVLDGGALAVTEIVPKEGFYDYRNKYTVGRTVEITPADIPRETEKMLKDAAIRAHNALGLGYYSRVDIILEERTHTPWVLEVNALPGMTDLSLLPQGAKACGIEFDVLCERILHHCVK